MSCLSDGRVHRDHGIRSWFDLDRLTDQPSWMDYRFIPSRFVLRPEMTDAYRWQCGDCQTLIEGPETRKCPNCGGINFFPLADEVPSDEEGTVIIEGDIARALERLDSKEP